MKLNFKLFRMVQKLTLRNLTDYPRVSDSVLKTGVMKSGRESRTPQSMDLLLILESM